MNFKEYLNEAPDTLYQENISKNIGDVITHKGKDTKFKLVATDSGALIFMDGNSLTSVKTKE
jgi:hypothetical protein